MASRLELDALLRALIPEGTVYYQPGSNITMSYPCIVYERDYSNAQHADNAPYRQTWRYQVTLIGRKPDNPLVDKLVMLPKCLYVRHFETSQLHHDVFNIYY
jgi:hypothetical protein